MKRFTVSLQWKSEQDRAKCGDAAPEARMHPFVQGDFVRFDEAQAAVAAERERCARIVESHANTDPDRAIAAAAAEIRSGK